MRQRLDAPQLAHRRSIDLFLLLLIVVGTFQFSLELTGQSPEKESGNTSSISFRNHILPIFQSHCFGCHQPAQSQGSYDMTRYTRLISGGESGLSAIVPGDASASYLIELITAHDGEAQMPLEGQPLSSDQVELVQRWIDDGAVDDSRTVEVEYTLDNPPTYHRPPNITSLDISSDGKWLAVSGFHEILLFDTTTWELSNRLIGLSARIESLRFSPDGKRLAAVGGNPGELGEVQVWDVESASLSMSKPISHDSIYGVCWSPDGSLLAFGGADSTLRAIDSTNGELALFQSAHEDFIRDVTFSADGSHLISVSRDMTCKLTEVATERFVDNITSITPLVLKGGIASIARHPHRDEVLIGGSDGTPKVYRVHRLTKRVIGDDANLIRRFPEIEGRIDAVTISADGRWLAVAGSLDNHSIVRVYAYNFDGTLPDDVRAINSKVVDQQTPTEKQRLEEYVTADISLNFEAEITSDTQSMSFAVDGLSLFIAGSDGIIRIVDTASGGLIREFSPVPVDAVDEESLRRRYLLSESELALRPMPQNQVSVSGVKRLQVFPEAVNLSSPLDYAQMVILGEVQSGNEFHWVDVSGDVEFTHVSEELWVENGIVQAREFGEFEFQIRLGDLKQTVAVTALDHNLSTSQISSEPAHSSTSMEEAWKLDFSRDVAPVLTALTCNAGTCHGSQDGQNGFKLSLRGYDRLFDVRSLVGEVAARRVDRSFADNSLMLLKPSGEIPHVGGVLLNKEDKAYRIIRDWIAAGAVLDSITNPVVALDVEPKNPVIQQADHQQSFRIIATFTDGNQRDVTLEAVIESNNLEVVTVKGNIATGLRRGEAALLARYEGAYAATTMTVMGDRSAFVWSDFPAFNPIDEFIIEKWKMLKLKPAPVCDDSTFVRRIYLDLTGLPPSIEQLETYLADERDSHVKRNELIEQLVGNESFIEHWTNKWADLLQVNRKYLDVDGAVKFRQWIRDHVANNTPYDQFVREILTATGSNNENPAASYFKILRTPEEIMENTTHLFLATRFNCNKCHDHPFERWTQDQYYETAAYFAQIDLTMDPASGDKRIGGSAVEGAKPLYEFVSDKAEGDVIHDRTRQIVPPNFPFDFDLDLDDSDSRREQFATWTTSPDNPYFAKSYVNRIWAYLMGVGLIEPIDDIRAGNPPSNPQLLDYLTKEFIESGFDKRHLIRLICQSRVYQLSIETNEFNFDDQSNYSKAMARRLPAEVIYDAIHFVTGSKPTATSGRAVTLTDSGDTVASGFLETLGRPARESACECERSSDVQLGAVLALVSGPDVARAISDPQSALTKLVASLPDDRNLIEQIYLRFLGRMPTSTEIETVLQLQENVSIEHQQLTQSRDARAQVVAETRPRLEQERADAIAAAQTDLDQVIAAKDPTFPERERVHQEAIESAQAALQDFHENYDLNFEKWKRTQIEDIQWMHVVPTNIESTSGKGEFLVRSDRSILVSGQPGQTEYVITTQTGSVGIHAVRLEVLTDDSLPGNGPGLAKNGNFVLSEFEVEIAALGSDEWVTVPISGGTADFEQQTYKIASTLNGNSGGGNDNGWAVVPEVGKSHWATYQFSIPVGYRTGSQLRFRLHQNYDYDDTHQIGCFRLSLSQHERPVGLSLSEDYLAKLCSSEIDDDDLKTIRGLFKQGSFELRHLNQRLEQASKPLEIDPEILAKRAILARVSKPLGNDVELSQLEQDLIWSTQQLEQARLTMAQDLAWALINSPAFLFNY